MCDEHVFNCFFPFSLNILDFAFADEKHVADAGFWAHVAPTPFFPLSMWHTKKNFVLMCCNKLLDDAAHCHSNNVCVCAELLHRIKRMNIHCNARTLLSSSHSKRVDFKFIFICLDLSLELFFIPLTISSVHSNNGSNCLSSLFVAYTQPERETEKKRVCVCVVYPQSRKSITCSTVR